MKNGFQRYPILVIALILLHLAAFTQENKFVKKNLVYQPKQEKKPAATPAISNPFAIETPMRISFTNSNYQIPIHQGIICRKEYAFEKKTGLPLKLRLGTYEEAHRLEYGK